MAVLRKLSRELIRVLAHPSAEPVLETKELLETKPFLRAFFGAELCRCPNIIMPRAARMWQIVADKRGFGDTFFEKFVNCRLLVKLDLAGLLGPRRNDGNEFLLRERSHRWQGEKQPSALSKKAHCRADAEN
jgi:hypothetical protein